MIGLLTRYVPEGKYTVAGYLVLLGHLALQRPLSEIAKLIAAVSSVTPSPLAL